MKHLRTDALETLRSKLRRLIADDAENMDEDGGTVIGCCFYTLQDLDYVLKEVLSNSPFVRLPEQFRF